MNDRWIEELARVAKEEEASEHRQLDDRWDRLAAGTLDAEETAALRAEALATPAGRRAWEAFEPLGAEFQATVVARLQAERSAARPAAARTPRRGRLPLFVASGLLAAGLAAFGLLRPFLSPPPPLPPYSISVTVEGLRGANDKRIVLGKDAKIGLQPEETSRGPLEVQCVAVPTGEAPRFWPACKGHLEFLPGGALRLSLPAAATADLRPGRLRVLVGRPESFPVPTETADADPEGRWRARWVEVSPPPP